MPMKTTTTQKVYTYNGVEYPSLYSLRRKNPYLIFPNTEEGMAQVGITVEEREEQIADVVIERQLTDGVQAWLDRRAKDRGYDNIYTCIGYYNSGVPRFKTDAEKGMAWRDVVWVRCNELLAQWYAGQLQEIPTVEELIEMLPNIDWEDGEQPNPTSEEIAQSTEA